MVLQKLSLCKLTGLIEKYSQNPITEKKKKKKNIIQVNNDIKTR
jgi:hypothetical protein